MHGLPTAVTTTCMAQLAPKLAHAAVQAALAPQRSSQQHPVPAPAPSEFVQHRLGELKRLRRGLAEIAQLLPLLHVAVEALGRH